MRRNRLVSVTVVAAIAAAACAAVSFDTSNGTGSVDAADVKGAFGWTTAQFGANASGVSFNYREQETVNVTCTWFAAEGTGTAQTMTFPVSTSTEWPLLSSVITGRKGVTGYSLNGFAYMISDGVSIPKLGQACPYASPTAQVTSVSPTSSFKVLTAMHGTSFANIPLTRTRGK